MVKVYRPDVQLFETCGCLLLCRKYDYDLRYEMRKGYSEWSVKYRVNFNDDVLCPRKSGTDPIVSSIVLGEREEDLLIVIKDCTKIFQYKLVLKTSQDLYDLKSLGSFYCFRFIASFAGVDL
ncbi:hypothetical protein Tco_0655836 [Tanacetum coccineum]|uniref:Uncharacterized protein n=1 Tax=Tanacetum coccineum TaxID=301880 RepID=A0ABQ4X752_9ASTR